MLFRSGGKIQFSFFVLLEGSDPFDIERLADIQQLAARSEIKVEVGGCQGLHLPGVLLNIDNKGVIGRGNIRVLKGNARSRLLSYAVRLLWDDSSGVEGEAANTRKIELTGLIQVLRQ